RLRTRVSASRKKSRDKRPPIGLLACGSSGSWSIDIDETISGRHRWFAQIQGPSVYVYFEIPSLGVINRVLRFLNKPRHKDGRNAPYNPRRDALPVGGDETVVVKLIRDNRLADKYFLVIEDNKELHVSLTVTGADLKNLTGALRQAQDDVDAG